MGKKKGFPPPRPPPHFQPSTTFSLALSPAAGKPTSDVCDVPGVCAKVHVNGSQGYLTLLDRLFVPLNRCPAVGWPTSLPIVSRRATVFASWVHTRRSSACCWTYSGKKSSMMSFRSFCPEPTALSDCGSDRTFDSLFPAHMTKILSPNTTLLLTTFFLPYVYHTFGTRRERTGSRLALHRPAEGNTGTWRMGKCPVLLSASLDYVCHDRRLSTQARPTRDAVDSMG